MGIGRSDQLRDRTPEEQRESRFARARAEPGVIGALRSDHPDQPRERVMKLLNFISLIASKSWTPPPTRLVV